MTESGNPSILPSEAKVRQTFQNLWAAADPSNAARLDPLSRDIAAVVLSLLPGGCRLSILEAGSGTGKISAVLAQAGHDLTLLDTSGEALAISRRVFRISSRTFKGIRGSMFRIPVAAGTYDVVWNAGVIEHFYFEEQLAALREISRVLKPGGVLITLNPSARGRLYRVSKFVKEKLGRWKFGQEFPVRTLRPHCDAVRLHLQKEEEVLGPYQLLYIPYAGVPLYRLCRRSHLLSGGVTSLLGGYLRLSVIEKSAAVSAAL